MKGKLLLIPTPIGNQDFSRLFPPFNSDIIQNIDYFIVEDLRTGRRAIKSLGMQRSIDSLHFYQLNEHTHPSETEEFIAPCLEGKDVGLLSDAGMPCIADPGNIIVAKAHKNDIEVIPLIGPNSIFLALAASGLNGQSFAFNGYLPVNKYDREHQLQFFESLHKKTGQTQIFIETPYRNNHFFESILSVCSKNLLLCVATDIASEEQLIKTMSVEKWKKNKIDLHKRPTVFLLGSDFRRKSN